MSDLPPARRVLTLLFLGSLTLVQGGKGDALPFDLGLHVDFADGVGTASIRDDLVFEITRALDGARCFRSVHSPAGDGTESDLLLRFTILEVIDETDVEVSLAQTHDPNRPPDTGTRQVARLQIGFLMELSTVTDGVSVRSRRMNRREQYRPFLTEDPREEVRYRAMDTLARDAVTFACKGSLKKLTREIERARSSSLTAPTSR